VTKGWWAAVTGPQISPHVKDEKANSSTYSSNLKGIVINKGLMATLGKPTGFHTLLKFFRLDFLPILTAAQLRQL
jgi:hypothetical protein